MTSLTQDEANRLFEYRDGVLFWKEKPKCSRKADGGYEAGTVTTGGYKKVIVNGVKYYVHRLVFMMHHGYMPEIVDHIDRNTGNNAISNLRASDKSGNACNAKNRTDNTSGHKGVVWSKACKKWSARVHAKGKAIHLGVFEDFELACLVADEARSIYHGENANF